MDLITALHLKRGIRQSTLEPIDIEVYPRAVGQMGLAPSDVEMSAVVKASEVVEQGGVSEADFDRLQRVRESGALRFIKERYQIS